MDSFRGKSHLPSAWTSLISSQTPSHWDISCTDASGLDSVIDESSCQHMASALARYEILLDACEHYGLDLICQLSINYWQEWLAKPFLAAGRNPYDGKFKLFLPLTFQSQKNALIGTCAIQLLEWSRSISTGKMFVVSSA